MSVPPTRAAYTQAILSNLQQKKRVPRHVLIRAQPLNTSASHTNGTIFGKAAREATLPQPKVQRDALHTPVPVAALPKLDIRTDEKTMSTTSLSARPKSQSGSRSTENLRMDDGKEIPPWDPNFNGNTCRLTHAERMALAKRARLEARRAAELVRSKRDLLSQVVASCQWQRGDSCKELLYMLKDFINEDADEGIRLTRQQFLAGMKGHFAINDKDLEVLDRLFDVCAVGGKIDFREFSVNLASSMENDWESQLKFCFQAFDLNGDNHISRMEMARLLKVSLNAKSIKTREPVHPNAFDEKINEHLLHFNAIDTNNDHVISWDELKEAVTIDPILLEVFGYEVKHTHEALVATPLKADGLMWGLLPKPTEEQDRRVIAAQIKKMKKLLEDPRAFRTALDRAFSECDLDSNGSLSFDEMKSVMDTMTSWLGSRPIASDYMTCFERLDVNRDGSISITEFEPYFRESMMEGVAALEDYLKKPRVGQLEKRKSGTQPAAISVNALNGL